MRHVHRFYPPKPQPDVLSKKTNHNGQIPRTFLRLFYNYKFSNSGEILTLLRSLRQGNVFTRVCHSVHKGRGVYPSTDWGKGVCEKRVWTKGGICVDRECALAEPPPPSTLPRWSLKRAVRTLLECILVLNFYVFY